MRFSIIAFAVLPVALAQCPPGTTLQCCNSLQKSSDAAANNLLGLLGIAVTSPDTLVGLSCE